MPCRHISSKRRVDGQQDECINCRLPIIYDGDRWVWEQSLSKEAVRRLQTRYTLRRLREGAPRHA